MRVDFLKSPGDETPAHSVEFANAEALRHWLMQDRSGTHWLVAVHHGGARPVLVIGARAGYVTVRGGWDMPQADADTLWGYMDRAAQSERGVDQFLDGARDFARTTVFPGPKVLK